MRASRGTDKSSSDRHERMQNLDKSGSHTDGAAGQDGEGLQSKLQSRLRRGIIDQFGPDDAERFQPILHYVVSEIVKLTPEASEADFDRNEDALKEREKKLKNREQLFDQRKELFEKERESILNQQREAFKKEQKDLQQLTDKYHAQNWGLQERNRSFEIERAKFETDRQKLNSEREEMKTDREQVNKNKNENLRVVGELEKTRELAIMAEKDAKLEKEAGVKILADTIELQKKFWPDCLLKEEWNHWRDTIQQQANTDANAALLLAALHAYYAASRSDKPDLIFDALRRVGVCLYPQFAVEAERIARAFNETANVRFRLKVPKTGQPTDSIWMNFKPGVSSVTEVLSWAVFDFEGRISHRALVK